jgi:hypothetical protein
MHGLLTRQKVGVRPRCTLQAGLSSMTVDMLPTITSSHTHSLQCAATPMLGLQPLAFAYTRIGPDCHQSSLPSLRTQYAYYQGPLALTDLRPAFERAVRTLALALRAMAACVYPTR